MIPEYYAVATFILGSVFGYVLRERIGWVNTVRIMRSGITKYPIIESAGREE